MHSVRLPALIGSHPLGALASFGLLRLLAQWDVDVKLRFVLEDDWIAAIETNRYSSLATLIGELDGWLKSDTMSRMVNWEDDVRLLPEQFRDVLIRALHDQDTGLCAFLSSIVADGAVDAQKGLIKPSAFYMVSGQQSFLGGLREVLAQVKGSEASAFEEALSGPWRYRTRTHSLGWDPNTERLYALRHRAPTSEKPSCIAGAVILAFWAIPLFPAVSSAGRPLTIGFSRVEGDHHFSWPIFSQAIGLPELTSYLRAGPESWFANNHSRYRSGIERVYESTRAEFGQGYAVFRPARLSQLKNTKPKSSRRGAARI